MKNGLGQALTRYLQVVTTEIDNRRAAARPVDSRLAVLIGEDQILLGAVQRAEDGQEFQNLVREVAALYHPKGLARGTLSTLSRQIGDFFRTSGIYCDLFDGEAVGPEERLAQLKASLQATTGIVTYYAPIEWVYFDQERIPFGEFEIRRLTTSEMKSTFSDRIRRVFYPWARVSAAELAGYWFLIANETLPVDPPGTTFLHLQVQVDPHRARFSTPIDRALSLLALGDWAMRRPSTPDGEPQEAADLDTSVWLLPELVPFVISASTDYLDWPRRVPDTSALNRIDYTDAQTGETFASPNFQVFWDAAKADEFEQLLANALRALDAVRPNEQYWAFMDIALRFLGRGFTSEGIESLLWNVTAVDALLGEDNGGTKARLSARIGKMLGEEQKAKFNALYEIRSDLVHGNAQFKHEVLVHQLATARETARLAALWMLSYLAVVAAATRRFNCPVPGRKDILAILDGSSSARERNGAVVGALPKAFPRVNPWLDLRWLGQS